jgi:iron complex outermembrane receptor protein
VSKKVATLLITALASGIIFEAPALAQSSSPKAEEGGTQDIIVTARRRDEGLSRVPVSVSVVTAETLAKAQITTEQDLRFASPGLSVRSSLNSQTLNYAIRGQSQDAYSSSRPGVLPYFNEVQVGGQGTATAFYDLQSIQVLKGPQGTLFGRSATGGAVLFTTAKPTDTFQGYVSGLVGDHGALKAEGAISGPIAGDKLTGRLAGFYDRQHGFQKNLYDGQRLGDYSRYGFRASLTADLGSVKNEFVGDFFRGHGQQMAPIVGGVYPFTGGAFPFVPLEFLYAGVGSPAARATGISTISAFTGAPASVVAPFYDAYFANPKHSKSFLEEVAAQQARGPYIVNQNAENHFLTRNILISNTTTIPISDDVRFKNIFGFTSIRQNVGQDADGLPFQIVGQLPGHCSCNYTRQLSDELQVQGTAFDSKFDYVAGLYLSDERYKQNLANDNFDILLGVFSEPFANVVKNRTYAPYAQGTYKLTDSGLSATMGVRYTSEKVTRLTSDGDFNRTVLGNPPPTGYSYDQSTTFNKWSWTLGLQYQVDHLLLYTASRRAYRSGSFNLLQPPLNAPGSQGGDAFAAEKVTDVEVGAKLNDEIAGFPVRLNVAAYYNWDDKSQRAAYTFINGAPAVVTANVPAIRLYGIEFDGVVKLSRWLSVGANMNYTHARIANGTVNIGTSSVVYDTVEDTPKFSGVIFADAEVPVADDLDAIFHADAFRQSQTYTTAISGNSFGTTLPAYDIVNFRVGLDNKSSGWSLTANLKNAFKKVYYTGGVSTGVSYQVNLLVPGTPRTFTLEARLKF